MNAFPPNSAKLKRIFTSSVSKNLQILSSIKNFHDELSSEFHYRLSTGKYNTTIFINISGSLLIPHDEGRSGICLPDIYKRKNTTHKSFGNGTATFFAFLNEID